MLNSKLFLGKKCLTFLVLVIVSLSVNAQITYISPFTGNQGGVIPLFGHDAPIGGDMFIDWETFGSATTGAGQGSDCRVIVRGMTSGSDGESVVASGVVCTADGVYNGENGNNDVFFVNLNICNLPAGRYSIEVQCDEIGGDYDNSTGGVTAATTWNYFPPESPSPYYTGTSGACGVGDGLDNITEVGEGGVAGTPQLEFFNVGDADVYRSMVVINGLFMDMGKFQPGNPALPSNLNDLQNLYDPACVGVGNFPTNGFCVEDALILSGAEVNVTKRTDCGTADITGNRLYYRVYESSATPPAFSSFNIAFNDDCPNGYPSNTVFPVGGSCQNLNGILDQRWQTTTENIDLLALASTTGTYIVEFYTETDVVDCGGTASTVTEDNGGAFYSTTFTFSEPGQNGCPACTVGTPFAEQGFEDAGGWSYTANPTAFNTGSDIWDVVTSVGGITPSSGLQFWGVQDLASPSGTSAGAPGCLTFSDINIPSILGAVQVQFDYNINAYDAGDRFYYEVLVDGVGQGQVTLVDAASSAGWETLISDALLPTGNTNVGLQICFIQDGGSDQGGVDNVRLMPACGIQFGSAYTTCDANTTGTDTYTVTIPYAGVDGSGISANYGGSGTVTFDPTVANGTLTITNIPETENWSISLSGGCGSCTESASGNAPKCLGCPTTPTPPAGITVSSCITEASVDAQDTAADADGTLATPYGTWKAAVARAAAENILTIEFEAGVYSDNGSSDGFSATIPASLSGLNVYGNGAVINQENSAFSAEGFVHILSGTNNVTFWDLNFYNFADTRGGVAEITDVTGIVWNNCVFDGCNREGDAVEIKNTTGTVTDVRFNCCEFNNNTQTPNSNASAMEIDGDNNITVIFYETTWSCNDRNLQGGALRIPSGSNPNVEMYGGGFYDNVTVASNAADGGAIFMADGNMLIDGTEFVCNSAATGDQTSGGGAIKTNGGNLTVMNATFSGNDANNGTLNGYGGAINGNGFPPINIIINNSTFVANAASRGGAIYLGEEVNTTIANSNIDSNTTSGTGSFDGGGGVYQQAGTGTPRSQTPLTIDNTTISNNTTAAGGDQAGGLHIQGAETSDDTDSTTEDVIQIINSTLCGNTNSGGNLDYSINEDLSNVFGTAFASTDFIGVNTIGVGQAYGDFTASYNMGTCAVIPATTALACPACPGQPTATNACVACDADAGNITIPTDVGTTADGNTITICVGEEINAFTVDYTATDETDPGTNGVGNGYDLRYILADATGEIIEVSASGDFTTASLAAGTYDIFILSYDETNNTVTDIDTYLTNIDAGQTGGDIAAIVADDNDNSSYGLSQGTTPITDPVAFGTQCLDLDQLDNDGLDTDSEKVQIIITPCADLGNFTFIDFDNDGIFNNNDVPLAGVTVELYDATTDTAIPVYSGANAQTTDANGNYLFADVPPGDYYVVFTQPSGYVVSTAGSGDNQNNISGANGAGSTSDFTFAATSDDLTIDAGFTGTGTIGDFVWEDTSGDTVQDGGEPGINGVTLQLTWYGPDGVAGGTDDVIFTQMTVGGGTYDFTNLPPGNYIVDVISGQPAGYTLTTANDPTAVINLGSNEDYNDADFGYQPGAAFTCPTISAVTPNNSTVCSSNTNVDFTVDVANLFNTENSDQDYGISLVYFTSPAADPYTGGTLLTNITAPVAASVTQVTANSIAMPTTGGTYYVYAILNPAPTAPNDSCRPSSTTTITVNDPSCGTFPWDGND